MTLCKLRPVRTLQFSRSDVFLLANISAYVDLKGKFTEVCRHYSKEHRGLHVHFTSVVVSYLTTFEINSILTSFVLSGYKSNGKDSRSW